MIPFCSPISGRIWDPHNLPTTLSLLLLPVMTFGVRYGSDVSQQLWKMASPMWGAWSSPPELMNRLMHFDKAHLWGPPLLNFSLTAKVLRTQLARISDFCPSIES